MTIDLRSVPAVAGESAVKIRDVLRRSHGHFAKIGCRIGFNVTSDEHMNSRRPWKQPAICGETESGNYETTAHFLGTH